MEDEKNKKTMLKKPNLPGKDAYEQINYLYQAALQVLSTQPHNYELVRYYMKCLRDVKKKKVLKWSRDMKQSICNGCNMLLVPGITSQTRVRVNRRIVIKCISCNTIKRANTIKPNVTKSKKKKKKKKETTEKHSDESIK